VGDLISDECCPPGGMRLGRLIHALRDCPSPASWFPDAVLVARQPTHWSRLLRPHIPRSRPWRSERRDRCAINLSSTSDCLLPTRSAREESCCLCGLQAARQAARKTQRRPRVPAGKRIRREGRRRERHRPWTVSMSVAPDIVRANCVMSFRRPLNTRTVAATINSGSKKAAAPTVDATRIRTVVAGVASWCTSAALSRSNRARLPLTIPVAIHPKISSAKTNEALYRRKA
jgi:hypothetical protein